MPGTIERSVVGCIVPTVLVIAILGDAVPGFAGILDASWTAPTTNTDGSPLTDLGSYRVYLATSGAPCPTSSSFAVASPTPSPGPNQPVSSRLTGLRAGTPYSVAVTAVDLAGSESACSDVASGVARAEFAVSPTGPVNFGSVGVGSFAEQTFTVSNSGGGTVTGAAAVAAPFSIVSGSPFTLSGAGATQAVRVRFTPTTSTTASATVSFTANGDTISGIVTATGTGSAADTIAPSIAITSPTSASTFVATGSSLALGGTASDNVGVTQVAWTNNRGGNGTAAGTTSWSAGAIALQAGTNIITVTARDAAGNSRPATLTVTLSDSTPPTVAVTAPAAGATVSGTATVSATASDNVGVAGVQFKMDGANLGVEVTTPPYATTWSSGMIADGAHVLTAVARDAAGNVKTSAGVTVTVANGARDTTGPVISQPTASATSTSVTINWTTNKPGDAQVEYGKRTTYGRLTTLDSRLVTSHSQVITGLARHTLYHFRIRSRDAAGNLTLSSDFSFRTR
jgi:Big-like domain-containing protein/purple acid phosphatase-like protein